LRTNIAIGASNCQPSRINDQHAPGFTKKDVAIAIIAILATALTIFGTNYLLHKFVLDDPNDPLTTQGGLKPEQQINR
jgi:hypothetical protein